MKIFLFTLSLFSFSSFATTLHLWPNIPFNIEGANLCEYRVAHSQIRSQYMQEMVENAERLFYAGDFNPVTTLLRFNQLYHKNQVYARKGLGHTLENTFKAYLDGYYRQLTPKTRNIDFKYTNRLNQAINKPASQNTEPNLETNQFQKISAFAYGHYSFSPHCRGEILVTLTLITRGGDSKTYLGQGPVNTVMSKIASQIFEDYQRTKFPSTLRVGNKKLTLLGGLNGAVDKVQYPEEAENICQTLGARLPTAQEYKFINSYGSWSGGVTLGRNVWALKYPKVFIPYFRTLPVREYNQTNQKEIYYICVN